MTRGVWIDKTFDKDLGKIIISAEGLKRIAYDLEKYFITNGDVEVEAGLIKHKNGYTFAFKLPKKDENTNTKKTGKSNLVKKSGNTNKTK